MKENILSFPNDFKLTLGPEKVLGIPLGRIDERSNDAFWESLLVKMRAKLDIWRSRDLSLEGKTYLIKSIAVSQILYAIEMKEISEKHMKEVDRIIWDFLWAGKTCTVNKNLCTLPRDMGGLGLVDLKTVVKVKRIRWVIRVLQDKQEQNWAQLIENYLRCLDNKFGIDFFALKVTDSSDLIETLRIPEFYKNCIKCFQELLMNRKCLDNEDSIIWCNDSYRFKGKTLSYAHWSKSGIKTISQLYSQGEIKENEIYEKLRYKSGFLFEIATIKKVMPERFAHNTENSSVITHKKDDILQYEFVVPGLGIKCLNELSSSDLYKVILFKHPFEIKSKLYWNNKFTGVQIDWKLMFQQILNNDYLPKKCKDFNWKL